MSNIDLTEYPNSNAVAAFNGNEQRAKVFLDRYAQKDETGKPVETHPSAMFRRVAKGVAGLTQNQWNTQEADEFEALLADFKFVPGGRILSGAGTGTEVTFYNCYVIPVETEARRRSRGTLGTGEGLDNGNDSREAILDTIKVMVDIMSRGGGVGINWSTLRPSGAHLKRINATSSGPIDWMHFASVAVGTVEQGGSRRGAAMFMLDDWHPNVLDFIDSKRDLTRITNANISVCISDDFMRLVEQDGEWDFAFPDTSHPAYDAEWDGDIVAWQDKGYPIETYGTIPAREMWRKLAEAAWDNGEPGVVFLDRYNKQSTAQGVERIISVNPCGEQGLGAYSVCNLGAMNLAKYVVKDHAPYDKVFDFATFRNDVGTAVRFLDRVVDENFYFLPENEAVQKELRRIGLGVMGLADALILLGLRYGSPEAVKFTEEVFRSMKHAALTASADLAKDFGPAPAWRTEMLARPYLDDLNGEEFGGDVYQHVSEHGLRNLFLLTQAPTGTTSILAGVNSGIEPLFALGYWREDRTGKHWVQPQVLDAIGYDGGWTADYLVTANNVTVEEHIAMQAAAQKYIDSSVSKTINAPNSHTVEDVEKAYTLAYESGLKGLAYFRDGCGRAQVLSTESTMPLHPALGEENPGWSKEFGTTYQWLYQDASDTLADVKSDAEPIMALHRPYRRPEALTGRTHKTRAGSQTAYVTVNREVGAPDRPVEVFVSVGKSGTGMMEMGEAIGRLASIGLQKGLTLEDLIDQLDGVGNNGVLNRSLPSAIAAALKADIAAEAEAGVKVDQWVSQAATILQSSWGPETDEDFFVGVDPAAPGSDKTVVVKHEQPGMHWVPGIVLEADICPDCGEPTLRREEGCKKCVSCGYSAC